MDPVTLILAGAAALTLRITRPEKRPQPWGASMAIGWRESFLAGTAFVSGSVSLVCASAATCHGISCVGCCARCARRACANWDCFSNALREKSKARERVR